MIIKLQKYVLRELLKACVLTVIAMTFMLGFGGGLMDMLRSQGITARELVKLLVYLMPVVLTYSLPVAALFGTTITYGRLSASNEIDACRAGGINVHKLLLPAVLVSVLVFATTFSLTNYVIPALASKVESLVQRDMQTVAYLELKRRGYLARMNYVIHADRVEQVLPPQNGPQGSSQPGVIQLSGVAFLEHRSGIPVRYGTAETAMIQFYHFPDRPAEVIMQLNQVRAFDESRGQMVQADFQPTNPVQIPLFRKTRIKFLSLPELRAILQDPRQFGEIGRAMRGLRRLLQSSLIYEAIASQLYSSGRCELKSGTYTYVISVQPDNVRQNPSDGRIILTDKKDRVKVVQYRPGGHRTFLAEHVMIRCIDVEPSQPPVLRIMMKNVGVKDSQDVDPDRLVGHEDYTLDQIQAPESSLEQAQAISDEQLLDPEFSLQLNERLTKKRIGAKKLVHVVLRRASAEIHSRAAYSAGSLFLLPLGAALGVIFKGGHFVSAFALSFIPMMLVVVMNMMGRQLSTVTDAAFVGPGVIWLGCGLVAAADVVVLWKFLRR